MRPSISGLIVATAANCLLVAGLARAGTAEFGFDHLTLEDGLSQSVVTSILQDRVGFMWFGTGEGLNRYDGYNFVVYKFDAADPYTISDNFVTALCEPRQAGRWEIWVGTRAGLNRFDPHTERFTRYRSDRNQAGGLSSDQINGIIEDRDGRLWIATARGLNLRLAPSRPGDPERFVQLRHRPGDPTSLSHDNVTALWEDRTVPDTVIWAGTDAGLNRIKVHSSADSAPPRLSVSRYRGVPLGSLPSGESVRSLFQSHDGTLWVGTRSGRFYRLRRLGDGRYRSELGGSIAGANEIAAFLEHNRVIWIGTYGAGIHLLDLAGGEITALSHQPSEPRSIAGNFVVSLYQDRVGRIWAGATGGGVSAHFPAKRHFPGLGHDPFNLNTLSHRSVLSVFEDLNGTVWVGTVAGLNRLDLGTGVVERFRHDPSDPQSLPHPIVYALEAAPGSPGEALWVGTLEGLARLDVPSGRFTTFRHDPADPGSLPHNRVQSILVDRKGRTWVGTDGGVSRFDPATESFTNFSHKPGHPKSLVDNQVLRLFEDSRNRLWVATVSGVSCFDPETGESVNYRADSSGLVDDFVYSFCETLGKAGEPILWIGTRGGLNRFEPDSGRWAQYSEPDGMPSAVVVGVLSDNSGNVWLSTFRGVSRLDPVTGQFRNFGPSDGFLSYEFNWGAYHRGTGGRLYFGGIQGLNWFNPEGLAFNPNPPPVVLTSMQVLNREVEFGTAVSMLREIELPHDRNALSFEFAALDYTAPEQNRYAYRMEGVDTSWIDSGNRRYVGYTELSPGSYRFRVKASNNDGVWNENGVVLDIRIHPPIWRTWGAYLLYAVIIIGVVVGLERTRARRLRLAAELRLKESEARQLAEIDRLKTRFFTDVTHEFRTPLTLIQGSVERLKDMLPGGTEEVDGIVRNTGRLVTLIDQLLDLARLKAGKILLQPRIQDLAEFTRFVVSCFASLAESRGVELSCKIPGDAVLVAFDKDQLEKCIFNLLSNALKFTPSGGGVKISLSEVRETSAAFPRGHATLTVKDTGPGIPEHELERVFERFHRARGRGGDSRPGSGVGLALTRELVTLHGGDIRASSPEGARFTIRLPLAAVDRPTEIIPSSTSESAPHLPTTSVPSAGPTPRPADAPEILVVDDHPEMRLFLAQTLESKYTVRSAADGARALEEAAESPPDLIVSDVIMPGMDGLELCRRLREDERTSHIPVILLTARAEPSSRIEGLETGADAYLSKPFNRQELLTRIVNLIAQRRLLREKYTRRIQLDPKDIAVTSTDELFLRRVMGIVEEELSDFDFSVAELASQVGLSRVQLHRKLRALTGETPTDFIRTTRLRLAARLLAKGGINVTQAAYEVGFQNLSYFAKCFRERFGVTPSAYARNPIDEVPGR